MSGFKILNDKPLKSNELYSLFETVNDKGQIRYAKIFTTNKIQQYSLEETIQYNQEVLSDLQGELFPQNFNRIIATIPNQGFYTLMTEPFQINLQDYMHKTTISEIQALRIFDNVLKSIYSLYLNGYWHKNIRAEHFVRAGGIWKLDSLVFYEDLQLCTKLKSQFIFNSIYQPPEMYEKKIKIITDNDAFPIVVWNLGSLLLDLFFSVHKLHSYEILKLYKNEKFTLQGIKVKKTDIFSKKIKEILALMLHYDSKSRMKLEQVFSNQILSREVSRDYKQKSKNNNIVSTNFRIFTGGKSALSSARLSKQLREKGDKSFHISQVVRSKLLKNKQIEIIEIETLNDNSLGTLNAFENLCIANIQVIKSIFHRQPLTIQEILQRQQFKELVGKYKLFIDKSELLRFIQPKFAQIYYNQNSEQIILLSRYAVLSVALINLYKLAQSLHSTTVCKEFGFDFDQNFSSSVQFRVLKKCIHQKSQQLNKKISSIMLSLQTFPQKSKYFLKQSLIQQFLKNDLKIIDFNEIKTGYRKILKVSYDTVTKIFNNQNSEHSARLAMFIVYCIAIDKLYFPNQIVNNFSYFFSWNKLINNTNVYFQSFKKYVQEAEVKILILHARMILEKYFKI